MSTKKTTQITLYNKSIVTKESVVHPKNKLNELTGKEWIKFLKSWFVFDAKHSDLKEEREITKNTQDHPATFSPTLISDFINFFTKSKMNVLDPFVGIGSTLVACDRTNRFGFGIELNSKYAKIAEKRISKNQKLIQGDVRNISKMDLPPIDFCITSPPYWNMLHKIDVNQKKRIENGLDTKYSSKKNDLGNVENYEEFILEICNIFDNIYDVLRNGAYLVIIVENVINKDKMIPFAWDLAIRLTNTPYRYVLKKEKIWCQDHKILHPFGYPYAWVSNTHHHYCLIFRKERKDKK